MGSRSLPPFGSPVSSFAAFASAPSIFSSSRALLSPALSFSLSLPRNSLPSCSISSSGPHLVFGGFFRPILDTANRLYLCATICSSNAVACSAVQPRASALPIPICSSPISAGLDRRLRSLASSLERFAAISSGVGRLGLGGSTDSSHPTPAFSSASGASVGGATASGAPKTTRRAALAPATSASARAIAARISEPLTSSPSSSSTSESSGLDRSSLSDKTKESLAPDFRGESLEPASARAAAAAGNASRDVDTRTRHTSRPRSSFKGGDPSAVPSSPRPLSRSRESIPPPPGSSSPRPPASPPLARRYATYANANASAS
mmetsp:Transcript_4453/g.18249  ORF Transcript_4453/g.18249 Transcript_4453/m.18249 type:complete len:320 (-) Transcript_4453:1565-2524(-)